MSLLDTASLILTPNGYKASKLYSVKPTDASGDMTVVRATTATRVNSAGLIESVAINVPRLDYTNASCPSILVEPARTNSVLYSEQFDNASWGKSFVTATANTTTAPDNTSTADTITGIGALGARLIQSNSISFTASTSYSLSVFAKKGTNDFIQLFVPLGIGGMYANFNLNTGVVGTLGTVTGTAPTSSITNFGNGWYRCTINFTATTTTSTVTSISIVTSASAIRSETNTLTTSLILWGAQLEAGSTATSYIPTVASSVTRNADVISKTGISSLIGQTEGTLYAEVIGTKEITANNKFICIIGGTKNIHIAFYSSIINVVSNPIDISVSFTPNVNYKIAVRYLNTGNFRVYVNGVKTHEVNTYVGGTFTNLGIGNTIAGSSQVNSSINSVQLYKTALTHEQCISLTTL